MTHRTRVGRPGRHVDLLLEVLDDLPRRFLGRQLRRVDGDLGVVGGLVGVGDARELLR